MAICTEHDNSFICSKCDRAEMTKEVTSRLSKEEKQNLVELSWQMAHRFADYEVHRLKLKEFIERL